MSGLFITLEGGEGSGKTTQAKLLHDALTAAKKTCMLTREPGGSPGAEAIRQLLLTGAPDKWDAITETLLFQAARVDHVERVIKPALLRGEVVLCDRFLDSTIVYQGISKGLGMARVRQIHELTLGDFKPTLTIILDIDPTEGLKRAMARKGHETRFENMDKAFHERVRQGFLSLAKEEPERCVVVDASQTPAEVHGAIWNAVKKHLKL